MPQHALQCTITFALPVQARRLGCFRSLVLAALSLCCAGAVAPAAEQKDAEKLFLSGDYEGSIALAKQLVQERSDGEDAHLLLSRALLATGRYSEAEAAITNALEECRWSIRVRWQAREVFLYNGRNSEAGDIAAGIVRTVLAEPRAYREAPSMVVFGQAALAVGSDPKRILDSIFEAAKKSDPQLRDTYLASGGLALEKHDYALAAKRFQEGLKMLPEDPDLLCGLAQAYAPSDSALMLDALDSALTRNTNHVQSLLVLAEHSIDAEQYEQAQGFLDRIHRINPWSPDAWAYRAVLAHLQNHPDDEKTARDTALKFWPTNPRVDYLIGLKLSQNYRFTEGAQHQRQALQFDKNFLRAKGQLAEDLLRLGDEADGWELAQEVQAEDGYDVEAFNLTTLHDTLRKYATLTNENFILRLDKRSATIYGDRALALLEQARSNLCLKYEAEPQRPTTVEVFSNQKDFGVRTFGMPGDPGYLGVCFGRVITANGPDAHPGHAVNWEAVLWHEYCHVVTLGITHNKMPRWLSEGISVYEERQANPSWGEHMNPQYREMVLGDELKPISQLSAAFLNPRSSLHLQFAYYESSLVVEFIVQHFGLNSIKAILQDLADGTEINQAIEKHTVAMATLEKDFAAFARLKAVELAQGLDWEKPAFLSPNQMPRLAGTSEIASGNAATNPPPIATSPPDSNKEEDWASFSKNRPTNFWVLTHQADEFMTANRWEEARPVLQELIKFYPDFTGVDSPYRMLATVYRNLGQTNEELLLLKEFAQRDDAAPDAYQRLMELATAEKDWQTVELNADRYLAADPLVAVPHRFLAQAAEQLHEVPKAISSYRALLELGPADPALVHFKLAELLQQSGDSEARRHVLQALEEAPRYRAALRLLLEIEQASNPGGT